MFNISAVSFVVTHLSCLINFFHYFPRTHCMFDFDENASTNVDPLGYRASYPIVDC